MLNSIFATLIGIATASMGLLSMSVYGQDNVREIVVDGHIFHVPEGYIIKGTIPWLPENPNEGFSFVVNPEAALQEQMIVGLEPQKIMCRYADRTVSDILPQACALAEKGEDYQFGKDFMPEKIYPFEGITFQWEYQIKDPNGQSRTIASCVTRRNIKGGSCWSINNYNGLMYSVSVRDYDIHSIPKVWKRVNSLLASWEQ